jgi:hypothetical protein
VVTDQRHSLFFLKNMSELLLTKIARRAADRRTQIDMGEQSVPRIALPLKKSEAEASEQALGFSVPPLLTQLYEKVGNGGFGPGYGLMGLVSGATDDQGHNSVDAYKCYASADPSDPSWTWPEGLLPLCHWGCAIYSCVACKTDGHPIVIFDPNMHESSWAQCFIQTKQNLESWLVAWAAGTKLWDETYGTEQEA